MIPTSVDTRRLRPSLALVETGDDLGLCLSTRRRYVRCRQRWKDSVRNRFVRVLAQRNGSREEASDPVSASREALESVVTEIEGLLAQHPEEPTSKHRVLRNQLTHCLERLHSKLETHEELSKRPEGQQRDLQLETLERGLGQIKAEVVDLKTRLKALTQVHADTMSSCLAELETISFKDFTCFDRAEKEGLEELYSDFKGVLREGEDGAVELAKLIYAVKTLKEQRDAAEQGPIASVEKQTLTRIFDIYATLFPSSKEEMPSPPPASTPSMPPVPKETPPGPEPSRGGNGGNGGSDDSGNGSSDDGDEGGEGGLNWGLILIFGILVSAVSLVIYLPEDKTEIGKKLKIVQEWFLRVTGRTPPPPPQNNNNKNNRRGRS